MLCNTSPVSLHYELVLQVRLSADEPCQNSSVPAWLLQPSGGMALAMQGDYTAPSAHAAKSKAKHEGYWVATWCPWSWSWAGLILSGERFHKRGNSVGCRHQHAHLLACVLFDDAIDCAASTRSKLTPDSVHVFARRDPVAWVEQSAVFGREECWVHVDLHLRDAWRTTTAIPRQLRVV